MTITYARFNFFCSKFRGINMKIMLRVLRIPVLTFLLAPLSLSPSLATTKSSNPSSRISRLEVKRKFRRAARAKREYGESSTRGFRHALQCLSLAPSRVSRAVVHFYLFRPVTHVGIRAPTRLEPASCIAHSSNFSKFLFVTIPPPSILDLSRSKEREKEKWSPSRLPRTRRDESVVSPSWRCANSLQADDDSSSIGSKHRARRRTRTVLDSAPLLPRDWTVLLVRNQLLIRISRLARIPILSDSFWGPDWPTTDREINYRAHHGAPQAPYVRPWGSVGPLPLSFANDSTLFRADSRNRLIITGRDVATEVTSIICAELLGQRPRGAYRGVREGETVWRG